MGWEEVVVMVLPLSVLEVVWTAMMEQMALVMAVMVVMGPLALEAAVIPAEQ
jgi:hypothetical protein